MVLKWTYFNVLHIRPKTSNNIHHCLIVAILTHNYRKQFLRFPIPENQCDYYFLPILLCTLAAYSTELWWQRPCCTRKSGLRLVLCMHFVEDRLAGNAVMFRGSQFESYFLFVQDSVGTNDLVVILLDILQLFVLQFNEFFQLFYAFN